MKFEPLKINEVRAARKIFEKNEPRYFLYLAATELINLSLKDSNRLTKLSLGQALSVLLLTWNKTYYQYHCRFDRKHINDIDSLIVKFLNELMNYRDRSLESFSYRDTVKIINIFENLMDY